MPAPRDLLPALTPLRFPAALAAIVVHIGFTEALRLPDGPQLPPRLWNLWAGLSFFFVLSGFILTHNYLNEFQKPTAKGVWNFLAARLSRVYPVHVLALLLMLPVQASLLAGGEFGPPALAVGLQLGFGIAWVPLDTRLADSFNSPAWSLSAEWFFYLLLPFLIPALTRGSVARRAAVVALVLAPWAVAVVLALTGQVGPMAPYRVPAVRAFDFVAGVLLALWWHRPRAAAVAPPTGARAALAEFAALALAVAWFWVLVLRTKRPEVMAITGWCGIHVPPFLPLIWVLANGRGPLARLLATKVPTYLGDISFALYMLHMPVINYFAYYGHHIGFGGLPWAARFGCVLGTALVFAVACYHLFELPIRDRLRRAISIKKPKPAVPLIETPPEVRKAA
jgi:peptidoglycan/LPS O-acetylase OafA/YrhL